MSDMTSRYTVAVATVLPSQLRPVSNKDIAHVRELATHERVFLNSGGSRLMPFVPRALYVDAHFFRS